MDEKEIKRKIATVDAEYLSPEERATIIWNALQEGYSARYRETPEPYDVMMFANEYMAQMALAMGDNELLKLVKKTSNWIYSVHYSQPAVLHGEPDRTEWTDRLAKEIRHGVFKSEDSN